MLRKLHQHVWLLLASRLVFGTFVMPVGQFLTKLAFGLDGYPLDKSWLALRCLPLR